MQQVSHTRQIDGCLTPVNDSIHSDKIQHGIMSPSNVIPSPPLSPHNRDCEKSNNVIKLLFPKATKPIQTRILDSKSDLSKKNEEEKAGEAFPVENMIHTTLFINPFQDVRTPGYKERQLSFLAHYKLTQAKPSVLPVIDESPSSKRHGVSGQLSGSGIRASYNTVSRSRTEKRKLDYSERHKSRRALRPSTPVNSNKSEAPLTPPRKRRRRKPTTRKANSATSRYDYDYTKIPDYCPPLSSLPSNSQCLKTEWKGQTMDLTDDSLLSKLHPAEIQLASTLRLPCKVYLDSKRRIFAEKFKRMKNHLPFRRTDAQKACKIDVNKASRLYVAYERVGWLDDVNFERFI